MKQEDQATAGEISAVHAAMERRSGLRVESFQPGDRVRILPRAQEGARGHTGTVVGFERHSKRGAPHGSVLVAVDQLPPVARPVSIPPGLLELDVPARQP